ncbi:MucBP domain protein [Weissella cibaria]|uniref:mucin-binding protein n=1 Tax=Weissella cibaria TaxID=137591 RepID=UPI0005B99417|nr:hypothetical protein [Weissella cibaria]KIU23558.1 MucBP domain protein [Weissella cibaria]
MADAEDQPAENAATTTPESAQSDTALTTEGSAAETADSEYVTETTPPADTTATDTEIQDDTTTDTVTDEQSNTDTTADTTSTTNDNDDVKAASEVSSEAPSATTVLSESASEPNATVLGETSTQEATVLTDEYVPTTEPEGVTVSVDTTIPVPNKESFTGSEYGLSSTVTVTYADKYLWINLPAVYNLNSIDMDALKAYAVRNRMIISFLQDGEQAKNTTTGLTDAQQATFDLFNKDAFNLMPATEVTNDDGTIIVYWPDSTEASTTFDSVDHDDIRIWAETNGLGWVVASEAWRRTDSGQVPPTGDQVLDTSNADLPAIIRNDANLLRTYFPIQYFLSASDKKQYVIFLARENRTYDPWGQTTKPGETLMIAEINSSGIIGRTYLTNGQTINLNGTTITDRFSAGSGDYYIGNYYTSTSTTLQSWTMQGITTKSTLADANYYYAIDNGDGTYTKTDIRIPVNESAGAGGDAKTTTLTGGSGGSFPDEYIITSDVLAGYQLVPSLTYASGQMSSSTSGTGTATKQTVRGKFMTNVYDQMSKSGANMYRTVLDPNNPFNLALVRAYGFDLSKVPVGAVVDKYVNSSGGYTVTIAWPVVDANGNETGKTSIIWDTGSNTIRFDTSASGGAATNPVKHYTIPRSPLTFYLQTNTTTGATSVVAATSVPTTAGYTFAKITGDIYKTTTGTLTFSDKDAFGNANILVATPDWLDEDRNGSIDGGSFTGFKNGGYGDKQNSFTIIGKFNVSGVNFYYVAAPQMATVGLKTAEKQADGTYKLVDTARTNTDGISNYANKTSGQKDSALQGVTGAVIGVARTGSTANDWSKINTKVPGYTYIGYTYNGGALQSVQKTDGTYAMPFENSNTKYNATASTSLSNGVITDSSADGIVLYYAIDSQQAQIKFVMADGTTAPANINLTGKTGGALTQDVASSIPAGYHIDTTKTTTTGSPAMTLSGTTVSGTYDATNNNLSATDASLQTMTITLVADTQTVKVRYIDVNGSTKETGWTAADGTEITDWVQTVTGDTGKTYTNVPWGMSTTGYVIVAQDAGTRSGTFDSDTNTDQTYYVYLKHNTTDVVGGKDGNAKWTVRATVRYFYEDDTTAAAANVRTTQFTATVTYDAVTGEALSETWDAESYTFSDVTSPVIQGYIADLSATGSATVTYTSGNVGFRVTYKALGAWTPSFPDTTPDNPPSDITYPNDPNDPTQPDRSNPSVPVVPYVPGYTPEGPNGPLTPVNPNDPSGGYLPPDVPTDPTADTTIVYHANEQTVTVNYIYVADDGTRTTVKTESFTGNSNAAYTHELWDYENNPDQSYVLVSKDAGAESGSFDADDDETQVFNVILAIGTESVPGGKDDDPNQSDYTKTITRTIHYVDQDGNQMVDANGNLVPDSVIRHTFTATVTYKVDSNVPVSVEWPNDAATFEGVKSPVITGYVADVTQVDADNIDHNDTDMTYTVTYKPMGSWTPSFPPNTENVPSDPIQYPNDSNNPTDNQTPHDPAEPGDPVIPYVPGYTPEGPDGTPLTPVDPDNPSAGYWPPETPTDKPGDDTVIHYVANDQAARITYIDDDTGLELAVDTIAGESSDTSTYTTADRIKSYEAQGYTLVSNDFPEDEFQFDRDDATEQKFEVHLKRTVLVITPDDPRTPSDPIFTPGEPVDPSDPSSPTYPAEPGTPGEPIDPANPSGPTWPETPTYPVGLTAEDLNQTVNLTVNYVYEDGTTVAHDPHTDAVHFTRTATLDTVTGEVTYSDWVAVNDDDLLDTYKSPVIDGYYADKAYSTAVTVAAEDGDVTETVTYKKLGQWVPSFPATTPSAPTDPIDYPNNPSDPTVPTDPAENPSEPGTPENPTLPYVPGYTPAGPDGEPLTPADPSNPSSGYLPPNPTNPGEDTVITYVPADQVGSVTYVDTTTGTTLSVDPLAGKSDEPGTYTTADRIKQYEAMGYVLVTDGYPTGFTFDSDTTKSQDFTVTLKQVTVVVTPDDPKNPSGPTWPATPTYPAGVTTSDLNKTVTQTVTYVYEDGSEAATTVTDNVVFERTATVNAVTGAVTYGEWTAVGDDVDWQQVDSPMIVGYMADKASVEFVDVTGATESTSVVVTYTAVGQWVPHFPPGTEDVPSDPINYPNNPDDPTNPADPGPDNPADPGTTDNPTLPYVPGFTPQGPDGQPLEPVNPSNPSEGYWPPVIPDDPKQSQDITYTANEQTARIVFIDDTTGTTLATDDIDGVSDEKSTYTTADRLATYYAQGYTLVSDEYPADFAFDRVDGNVETFEVHLKHAAITVTPDDPKNPSTPIYTPGDPVDPSDPDSPTYPAEPGTPGEPIDPDNPSGPTWPAVPTYPAGVTTTDLKETVNRTITYVDEAGNTVFDDATDKVSFTRTATVDAVTGEVTYGEWVATGNDTTFDAVN